MVVDLKTLGYVNLFLITLNSEEPRFNDQLKSSIKLFSQMFGIDFFQNVLICFTKFNMDKKAIKLRENGKLLTKESLISSYIKEFKKVFEVSLDQS
jgi:uncharacterized protein YqkB